MTELKKYTSFKALKMGEKPEHTDGRDQVFSEFEAFIRQLQMEYTHKKKDKADRGKQPGK